MKVAFYGPDYQKLLMCPLIKRLAEHFFCDRAFETLSRTFEILDRAFKALGRAFEDLREN